MQCNISSVREIPGGQANGFLDLMFFKQEIFFF